MRHHMLLMAMAAVLSGSVGGSVLAQSASTVPKAAATSVPGNLLSGPDGARSWTAHGATTSTQPDGVRIVPAVPGPVDAQRSAITVIQGSIYAGTFEERASDATTGVTATLSWYDKAGTQLTDETVRSASEKDSADAWTRYTVAGLVPARAVTVMLGAAFDEAKAGSLHTIRGSALTRRPQGSAALAGPLITRGTTIRDAHGAVVTLRGLNRPGQWDAGQPGGLDERDIDRIKAWGGNVVRLTLGQQKWLPGCDSYDRTYPQAVDAAVRWITRRGMLAILDLHFGSPTCRSTGANPLPDERSLQFWTSVAGRYKSNPLVAFDLYNEPYGVPADVWKDGGTARSTTGLDYHAVGLQQVYDAVRATGANGLVLVSGLDYASTPPGEERLTGRNLVWAVHAYACSVPWRCYTSDPREVLGRFSAIARRLPVMVSEFGYPSSRNASSAAYNARVVAYAEAQHWSWAAWAWDVHGTCRTGQYFNLLSSTTCATGTGTYQPSPAGVPVLLGLSRN